MELYINGVKCTMDGAAFDNELADAVFRSLFTWARARADDKLINPGERWGWWGDLLADDKTDRYGSRLWKLLRTADTAQTRLQAQDICEDALQWMVTDGLCADFTVEVEHYGMGAIAIQVTLKKQNGQEEMINFAGLWDGIH